jgi:hypothetical protein
MMNSPPWTSRISFAIFRGRSTDSSDKSVVVVAVEKVPAR